MGQAGYNQVDTIQARLTKNCECMDLSKQELALLKEGVTMENRLHYPELEGYNFRGAKMDSAKFFFAIIRNSDFRGAKMATLQYGYTTINGITDKFTQMPNQGDCTSTNNSFSCFR